MMFSLSWDNLIMACESSAHMNTDFFHEYHPSIIIFLSSPARCKLKNHSIVNSNQSYICIYIYMAEWEQIKNFGSFSLSTSHLKIYITWPSDTIDSISILACSTRSILKRKKRPWNSLFIGITYIYITIYTMNIWRPVKSVHGRSNARLTLCGFWFGFAPKHNNNYYHIISE